MRLKRNNIGELEELVLLVIAVLGENAYGISVMDELKKQSDRKMSISAVHTVLNRLEEKGYLISEMGGETNERGGRRKRFFKLTGSGKDAIEEVRQLREKLWSLIPG